RCVGANSDVMPDIYAGTVKPRDLFLLASDGLTGMLEDYQLSELLSPERMPQDEVDSLIAEANRHGGLDNITAILVRIDSVEPPAAQAGQRHVEHVRLGWEIEKELIGAQAELRGESLFHALEQVGIARRPVMGLGGQLGRGNVERALGEPPLAQRLRQAGLILVLQVVTQRVIG